MKCERTTLETSDIKADHRQKPLSNERLYIIESVRKWGGDNTDAILDPKCKIFKSPTIEGLIGYRLASNSAVVIGDPVCAAKDKGPLATEFHTYCEKNKHQVIYISASEEFAFWANQQICPLSIEWGEKLYLDPHNNPYNNKGSKGSLVRRKVKQAIREGTEILEYLPDDPKLEAAIEEVGVKWLASRDKPQVHISNVHLFNDRLGKRWIYAKRSEKIVGVVILNQLQAQEGWLMNHLMLTPEASNGTPELLVFSALEILEKEGCHFVTFGATPVPELRKIFGMGWISASLTRFIYRVANKVFHLDGLKMFWGKFQPESKRSYLLFSRKKITPRTLGALMNALNVRFFKQ